MATRVIWVVPYQLHLPLYDPPARAFGQALAQPRKCKPAVADRPHDRLILKAFDRFVGSLTQQKSRQRAATEWRRYVSVLGGTVIVTTPHLLLRSACNRTLVLHPNPKKTQFASRAKKLKESAFTAESAHSVSSTRTLSLLVQLDPDRLKQNTKPAKF